MCIKQQKLLTKNWKKLDELYSNIKINNLKKTQKKIFSKGLKIWSHFNSLFQPRSHISCSPKSFHCIPLILYFIFLDAPFKIF